MIMKAFGKLFFSIGIKPIPTFTSFEASKNNGQVFGRNPRLQSTQCFILTIHNNEPS